ncbi:MAG: hypothetical protein K2W78_08095 [Xanthobacteraceae bacterium]|nr:hypothetical protein [Xanthobacteraceae bacterium]
MPQIAVPADELKKSALSSIRSRRGCDGVEDIVILRVNFEKARSNWSLKITDFGNADRDLAQLSAITVQRHLQQRYRLTD